MVHDDKAASVAATGGMFRCYAAGPVRYDAERRRVWVGEQRLHHGFTGALLAGLGMAGLAAHRLTTRGGVEWALIGSLLMAHDWHDRSLWFRRGAQEDLD
jgi:hypothetical protein